MTEAELRQAFARYIADAQADGFPDHIEVYPDQYVPIANFLQLFGSCPLTHSALVETDGGVRGYKDFFDRAKADGVLS